MTALQLQPEQENRLTAILSSAQKSADFCKRFYPGARFAMARGCLCTPASMIKTISGASSMNHLIYDDYPSRKYFANIESEIVWLKTQEDTYDFADRLGVLRRSLTGALAKHGKVMAFSSRVAAISLLSSLPESRDSLIEWTESGASLRRFLYANLGSIPMSSPSESDKPEILDNVSNIVSITRKAEPVAVAPAVTRPDWIAPEHIAYTDASLWTKGSGCSIAAFHPHSMTARVIYLPIPCGIDSLEVEAIALAHESFNATHIFTDSQNAQKQFDYLKASTRHGSGKPIEKLTGHLAYGLRDVALAKGTIEWIPRTKNIVADAVAVWSSRNKYSGKVKVEFTADVNLANPAEVDTTKEWIHLTPIAEKKENSIEEMVERLNVRKFTLERELTQVTNDLTVLTKHADIFNRYMIG
jgi:hypothetical protein